METFNIYLTVRLKIKAQNREEVTNVLENMDYSFTDPREEIPENEIEMDAEIWSWEDEIGEPFGGI